jgi:hypothetical protein
VKLPDLAFMFSKAVERARETGDWVNAKRDFEAVVDGVPCQVRCRAQVIVSPEGSSRRLTGEVIAMVMTAGGERVEIQPGWIHFSARDGAIVDPEPLFELAASEAARNLRGVPSFRARVERAALRLAIADVPRRAPRRL